MNERIKTYLELVAQKSDINNIDSSGDMQTALEEIHQLTTIELKHIADGEQTKREAIKQDIAQTNLN